MHILFCKNAEKQFENCVSCLLLLSSSLLVFNCLYTVPMKANSTVCICIKKAQYILYFNDNANNNYM
jgi:hypothetical protein